MSVSLIVTAPYDPLRDECPEDATRLREAGVQAEHKDYPDYLHGFLSVPKLCVGVDTAWSKSPAS